MKATQFRKIRAAMFAFGYPFIALFLKRHPFAVFFPSPSGWKAYLRGKTFDIQRPNFASLEYYKYFFPEEGGIIFDVGGELGIESKQLSVMAGDTGVVFVFECFPDHVRKLRRLQAAYPNITLVEAACWNEKTSLSFHTGNTAGSNTAIPDAQGQSGQLLGKLDAQTISVPANTLDYFWETLANESQVDFLKMDIEGAEYEALEGAKKLLAVTSKIVVAAYHIRDGVPTADKVLEILQTSGFRSWIDPSNLHVYGVRA